MAQPDLAAAEASKTTTFDSPAGRSVKAPAAGNGKAAAAAQATDPNPDLAVGLLATTISAHGLELDSAVTSVNTPLEISIDWGDKTSVMEYADGTETVTSAHTYAEVGTYTVKVTVTDTVNQTSVDNSVTVTTNGSDFTPYGPTRLLDTRNGTGAAQHKIAPYTSARVKIGGNGAIPAGVTAVALNITVTSATSGGHIIAFADGDTRPTTSNVNFAPGQTVPNLAIVPVGANGYVDLYNGGWESVDLIADVTGYFTQSASSGYTAITPDRFVDTRTGVGTGRGQVPGYGTFSTPVAGTRGVPAGAKAVALNVTVTNPRSDGHLTVFPTGQSAPTASNLNFSAGQTIANSVIVPIGADGRISVRNGGWNPADVIVDVVGYYSPDSVSAYLPFNPERVTDTRVKGGPLPGRYYAYLGLGSGLPHSTGFVLNTTVTNTKDTGYLAVTPDPNSIEDYDLEIDIAPPLPTSSNLNWTVGKTVPNLVQAGRGSTGVIDFWNESDGAIDVIIDIFGVYKDN
ncbi:hypothetical protein J7F03_17925 [Streptomyces sp. ISL-43]|uniref:hypothetical protein n=1 Tax=Streptomyces sp. ISL-43 TaxID=2819183 RepID=UPI001BE852A5|nr:hypothetical protein [Streptomyces sp. ISL-43]MBT2448938.1 hypothetical protein [Streptomyces sp. ISL-43]